MGKLDVVQGLLEGKRVGAYTYYVGLHVRTHTDSSLYGDRIDIGTIRAFHATVPYLAWVEVDQNHAAIPATLRPGNGRDRLRAVPLRSLIPLDY